MNNNTTQKNITAPINVLTSTIEYSNWREGFILAILRIASILGIALIIASWQTSANNVRIFYIAIYAILLAVTFLRLGYNLRAFTFISIIFLVGLNALLSWGPMVDGSLFLLAVVAFAALLFDTRVDIIAIIAAALIMMILAALGQYGLFSPTSPAAPAPTLNSWLVYIADFLMVGAGLLVAINLFKNEFLKATEQMVVNLQTLNNERNQLGLRVHEQQLTLDHKDQQLYSSTTIARSVTQIESTVDLIENAVSMIATEYGLQHVGLYLLDENRKVAFLQAASSAEGKLLIGQGHHIEAGTRNPINLVVEQNRAYKASDASGETFTRDPNFPSTRSRMTIPLIVRKRMLGILDLQSNQPDTFDLQDTNILQTLADVIGITMDNNRLVNETNTLLQQLELLTSSQTRETWARHTSRNMPIYQYTPAGVRPIFSQPNREEPRGSLQIPLVLQGQTIGKIRLRRKGVGENWSDKEREMVGKIAEQISLALENSRLVDEAQKSAQRDQLIANISSRIRETLDIDSVIRTATTELRKVFDLKEAEISVGLPQAQPKPVRKHTSTLRLK
jgi:GAF domain-containing protein